MKKNHVEHSPLRRALIKSIIMMKAVWILVMASVLQVTAGNTDSYSQNVKMNLNLKDACLDEVIWSIKKQTEFNFFYNTDDVKEINGLSLDWKDATAEEILTKCLAKTDLIFEIINETVIIKKADKPIPEMKTIVEQQLQKKELKGKVIDSQKQPIPGVIIIIKGTTTGTITDNKGNFNLTYTGDAKILAFSFVGMITQEITVGDKTYFPIVMEEQVIGIGEVVVVGYGTQKKETVTGSIVSVGNKELVQSPVSNISNSLVGRVAGLTALQSSGEPGDNAATIRIRGIGTFNGSGQDPLVIIDGVESSFSIMNGIDANEIENISVLKDASATAVYGVRGANGVIILTTKRGKLGKPQISFSSTFGFTQLTSKLKMLGSYDYALFKNEAIRSDKDPSYNYLLYTDDELWKFKNNRDYTPAEVNAMDLSAEKKAALLASPALYYTSHDYVNEQFGTSPQQQYNLNISGGGNRVRYFTSLGYFSQDGGFNNSSYGGEDVNSYYKRYNFRSNYDIDVNKNLKITADLSGQFATNGGVLGNAVDGPLNGPDGRHKAMMITIVDSPPYAGPGIVDGKLVSGFVQNSSPLQQKGASGYSAISNLLLRPYLTTYNTNLNVNIKLKYTLDYLTKGLSLSGTVSYNDTYVKGVYSSQSVPQYSVTRNPVNPAEILFYGGVVGPTTITDNFNSNKWRRQYFEGAANYNREFGKHAITGLVLFNAQKTFDPSLLYNVPSGLLGMAARATYNYNQRYFAEVDMGYNGSENFPPNKRYGLFPAYSAGWIISNESFFPKNNWITWLKLRGSYGVVGNDRIGGSRFLYLPNTWGYAGYYPYHGYSFGNSNGGSLDPYYMGAYESTVGNLNVTWERAKKTNLGLEISFLKNRLSFIGDVFQEKRDNILWALGTVPGIVAAVLPPANIGKVTNRGYEIQLGWTDKIGQVDYSIRGNVSYSNNRIDYMDEPAYPYAWMNQTGYAIGQYKGLKTDGFYNTEAEASNRQYSSSDGNKVQPGDIRYVDINGDGKIDASDKVPIGYSNLPKYAFNTTLSFGYKGFAASILFIGTAQGSFPIRGDQYMINPFYMGGSAAMQFQYDGRWTPEMVVQGITPTFPRASLRTSSTQNGIFSDFWLKSTDFIRLKNIEISYTFSKISFLKRAGLKGIRLFVNGNNLYTWTKLMDGIDPEQQDSGGASSGYLYPMTRVYNFGINIQF